MYMQNSLVMQKNHAKNILEDIYTSDDGSSRLLRKFFILFLQAHMKVGYDTSRPYDHGLAQAVPFVNQTIVPPPIHKYKTNTDKFDDDHPLNV